MKDYKEITGDKNRIDCQLGCKRAQASGGILFHEERLSVADYVNPFTFGEIRASATLRLRLNQSAGRLLR
jgi:hypothetical protein